MRHTGLMNQSMTRNSCNKNMFWFGGCFGVLLCTVSITAEFCSLIFLPNVCVCVFESLSSCSLVLAWVVSDLQPGGCAHCFGALCATNTYFYLEKDSRTFLQLKRRKLNKLQIRFPHVLCLQRGAQVTMQGSAQATDIIFIYTDDFPMKATV